MKCRRLGWVDDTLTSSVELLKDERIATQKVML